MPVNPLGLVGPILILAAVAILAVRRQRTGIRIVAAIAGAAIALLPIGSTTFGAFFLGVAGPVSAATLVMLGNFVGATILGRHERAWPSTALLVCLLLTGTAFYPLTFGLTSFDPYELGYRGLLVPGLMLAFVCAGWLARAADIPCWIGLTELLYVGGVYDSNNLWDYLIFPADPVYAAGALMLRAYRTRVRNGPGDQGKANLENSATMRS
jgi:hypothetical protein